MTERDAIRRRALASDRLHLILMPTEACNLRCTYCYEDFRLGRMPEVVVAGVERLLERRAPRLSRVDLSWFGGEPLAASDIVLRILRHAAWLAARRPGLVVKSDMTTNGWFLTPELFAALHDLGVTKYQVSFDGPAAAHDEKRVRKGGGATFDRLWRHIRAMQATDREFTVLLRLHVAADNREALPAFLDQVRHELGGDPRFRLFPKLLARWGGPADAALPVIPRGDGPAVLDGVRDQARALGVPLAEPEPGPSVCYAARANAMVIRSDGRINKCTIALEAPENQVGQLEPDGRVALRPDRLLPWMRGLDTESPGELACPKHGLVSAPVPLAETA
jgi:uncharacterized protein